MSHRVFITGASGFVGSAVLAELSARGHTAVALTRDGKLPAGDNKSGEHVQPFTGDLLDSTALQRGMAGCDAVIHLVGIIMENPAKGLTFQRIHVEGTRSVVTAAKAAGIARYVHMSALGVRAGATSEYAKTKFAAEQIVRESGLAWTIFQPSLIHGPRGEFMKQEAKWARGSAPPFLFMPYFGAGALGLGGAGLMQPIFVNDVARAFVDALDKPETIGRTYEIAGPDRFTWPQWHHAASRAIIGREKRAIAIPAWYALALTKLAPTSLLPFNRSQVLMSREDNVCDLGPFEKDFGWKPQSVASTLPTYVSRL